MNMIRFDKRFGPTYCCVLAIAMLVSTTTFASDHSIDLKLSIGTTLQSSNEVQIPNDDSGTRFSLADVTGEGPYPGVRVEGIWNINDKHALRVLLAPLSISETGDIGEDVLFEDGSFSADQRVMGGYTFNSWRVGYRFHLRQRKNWDFWLGATLKVRDAEVSLEQGDISSSNDNVGVVPLLYLAYEYRLNEHWAFTADLDGLAGGPGRAIDLGLGLEFSLSDQWKLGAEYRTLEGGADTDDVYNFAWFNSLLLSTRFSF